MFWYTLLGYVEARARVCSVFRAVCGHWAIELDVGKRWCRFVPIAFGSSHKRHALNDTLEV